jgi:hypothetical protein
MRAAIRLTISSSLARKTLWSDPPEPNLAFARQRLSGLPPADGRYLAREHAKERGPHRFDDRFDLVASPSDPVRAFQQPAAVGGRIIARSLSFEENGRSK